jgi:hypothetical protein
MDSSKLRPYKSEMTMLQKLTLSWNIVIRDQHKHSYAGTVAPELLLRRRAAAKRAKLVRRKNRH